MAEAQEELTKVMKEMNDGCYIPPTGKAFVEYSDDWLKGRVDVKGSDLEKLSVLLEQARQAVFGEKALTDVRPATVQTLVNRLRGQQAFTEHHQESLYNAEDDVQRCHPGKLKVNPATGTRLPQVDKPEIQPPDKTLVRKVLALAEKQGPDVKVIFLLETMTGLRRGEVLALRWRDIRLVE